jgi:hypothetical protein
MNNKLVIALDKREKDGSSRRDSQSPPHNPSIMLRDGSEFALHSSTSAPRRKKFITRMCEINSQPPANLALSYDPDSFPAQ